MSETQLIKPSKIGMRYQIPCDDKLVELSDDVAFLTRNIERLKSIQKVICLEEGQSMSLDEVLNRVLTFYRQYVPFD
jgi:hypothetical protein